MGGLLQRAGSIYEHARWCAPENTVALGGNSLKFCPNKHTKRLGEGGGGGGGGAEGGGVTFVKIVRSPPEAANNLASASSRTGARER